MAARVITVTSGKGGVGKTTATANLGVALATLGHKVVCLDADIGLRNLDVVMGLENRIVYDIVDVVEGRARLRQAMIKDKRLKDELYLIPAAQTRDKTAVSPSDMVRLCDELRPLVDFVLIDSPAGIERGFRNAVAPADEVLIVTNPEVSSVRDADRIIGLIEAEGKGPARLIINRVKPDMVKRGDMLSPDDIIDILAIDLIGLIPEDETILVSTNRGIPAALTLDNSLAGRAFLNIARRLNGEEVPFLPLEAEAGWLQRMFRRLKIAGAQADAVDVKTQPAVAAVNKAKEPAASGLAALDEVLEEKPAPAITKPADEKVKAAPAAEAAPAKEPDTKAEPATTQAEAADDKAQDDDKTGVKEAAAPAQAETGKEAPASAEASPVETAAQPAATPATTPAASPKDETEPKKVEPTDEAGKKTPAATVTVPADGSAAANVKEDDKGPAAP